MKWTRFSFFLSMERMKHLDNVFVVVVVHCFWIIIIIQPLIIIRCFLFLMIIYFLWTSKRIFFNDSLVRCANDDQLKEFSYRSGKRKILQLTNIFISVIWPTSIDNNQPTKNWSFLFQEKKRFPIQFSVRLVSIVCVCWIDRWKFLSKN